MGEGENVRLINSDCEECRSSKSAVVSLNSICRECGLDSLGVAYEIPVDIMDDVIRELFRLFDTHGIKPLNEQHEILTYNELLKRLHT